MAQRRTHPSRMQSATIASAASAVEQVDKRSTEMHAHLSEMTIAVTEVAVLYHALGIKVGTDPGPTTAEALTARRSGLEADRAVRRFQRTFQDWLSVLDRAARVGVALHAPSAPAPTSTSPLN